MRKIDDQKKAVCRVYRITDVLIAFLRSTFSSRATRSIPFACKFLTILRMPTSLIPIFSDNSRQDNGFSYKNFHDQPHVVRTHITEIDCFVGASRRYFFFRRVHFRPFHTPRLNPPPPLFYANFSDNRTANSPNAPFSYKNVMIVYRSRTVHAFSIVSDKSPADTPMPPNRTGNPIFSYNVSSSRKEGKARMSSDKTSSSSNFSAQPYTWKRTANILKPL